MNISDYVSCFHDGSLIDIKQQNNQIVFSIESAEVHKEELKDNVILSKHSTIKGALHLEGVKKILDNNQELIEPLKMLYDSGEILHLELTRDRMKLDISWVNYPPNSDIVAYSFYEIEAEKIWWENIPDLFDPFW